MPTEFFGKMLEDHNGYMY